MQFFRSPNKTRIKWSDGFYVVYVCISIAAPMLLFHPRGRTENGFVHKLCCAKSNEIVDTKNRFSGSIW